MRNDSGIGFPHNPCLKEIQRSGGQSRAVYQEAQILKDWTKGSNDRWHQYFHDSGVFGRRWLATAVDHWTFSERLRGNLIELTPPGGRILEIGCGPGHSGLLFTSLGFKYTGVDNEARLIERARSMADRLEYDAQFEVADARDLTRYYGSFDLVFSSGVLEHFERHETVKLLQEQSKCAPVVVISIPTPWTRYTGKVTDERFYSILRIAATRARRPVDSHPSIWLWRRRPKPLASSALQSLAANSSASGAGPRVCLRNCGSRPLHGTTLRDFKSSNASRNSLKTAGRPEGSC